MGVATAMAIGGLVLTAASTAKSFSDASKQRSMQDQAQASAAAAMAEARKKLEKNYYDQMAVKKEPYELQSEAMLSQGAQAIEAGKESERGAGAVAGRVSLAQNEAQAGIRTAMGQEMTDIENKKIAEQSRLRDIGVQLDLGQVEGAQEAAAKASENAAAATAQGWQGVTSFAQQGIQMMPLYFPNAKGGVNNINTAKASSNMQNMGQPNVSRPSGVGQVLPGAMNPFGKGGEQPLIQSASYANKGYDKFGSPIKMPGAEESYNYFKYY